MVFGMPVLIENPSIKENIELCKELGLGFIEINMSFPQYQLDFLNNTDLNILSSENGIFFTIHLDENFNIADFNPFTRDAYIKTIKGVIEVAKRNSIKTINMHMSHGIVVTLPDRKVHLYETYFEEYLKCFKEFREMCEELIGDDDIRISIENTDGFMDYEKKAIEYLLESKVFSLTWDIGHSVSTDEIDKPFIMEYEDRLRHFHIHDGTLNPPKNHLALGDGEAPLEDRLNLAFRKGCTCVLETKTIKALKKTVNWLKEHDYA